MRPLSQERLELGKELLDRVKVGAVGRQVQQAGPDGSDRLRDACHLVGCKVVEHDHIARSEGGRRHLLDISLEDLAPHGPIHDERSDDPVLPLTCHKGAGQPLPARRPAIAPGHVGSGSGLVEKHKAAGIHEPLPHPKAAAPLGYVRPVLLGRPECLFYASGPCA